MAFIEKMCLLAGFGFISLIFITEISLLIRFLINKRKNKKTKGLFSKLAILFHIIFLASLLCSGYAYFIEPYWIEVTEHVIETDKLNNTSFRIVQISDMHCDLKERNEPKLANMINSLNPDIVVFTGDIINDSAPAKADIEIKRFRSVLSSIKARLGKLAVYGNWDIRLKKDNSTFAGTGFNLLEGKSVQFEKDGQSISFTGIDMWSERTYRNLLGNINQNDFSVFLYHYSDLAENMNDLNVDLYLSGHTHGGQIALPWYGAIITLSKFGKKYEAGMYNIGDMKLYVNRGIGMEGGRAPRMRFCARPEISVFDIQPKNTTHKQP